MTLIDNTTTFPREYKVTILHLTYTVTVLTERCWLFTADHTGVTRQFCSAKAMHEFVGALTLFLHRKYGRRAAILAAD